jgi:hypothetical protein
MSDAHASSTLAGLSGAVSLMVVTVECLMMGCGLRIVWSDCAIQWNAVSYQLLNPRDCNGIENS